jgi:hypothetical protein
VDSSTWDLVVPTATHDAQIENNHTVYINEGDTADAYRVLLGDNEVGNTGTLTMYGGTLSTDRAISLGGFETASSGIGVLNQSGGDIYIGAHAPTEGAEMLAVGDSGSSKGYYNLSGGSLDAAEGVYVGYQADTTGEINQTGGQITSTLANIGMYGEGSYTLEDGSLTVSGKTFVGRYGSSSGTVAQSGGSFSTVDLTIADHASGLYTLTGGTVTVTGRLFVARNGDGSTTGVLNQSSGEISVTDAAWIGNINQSAGAYSLSGDAIAEFESDFNVCAAAGANGEAPQGVSGALNIDGEDVTITVGGDLIATGGLGD